MEIRELITFHHKVKIAKKSLISSNIIIADSEGRIKENIDYPYQNLELHPDIFEKINDDGEIGTYWLKK